MSAVDGHFLHGRWTFGTDERAAKARHLHDRPTVSSAHVDGEQIDVFCHGHAARLTPDNPAWHETITHWTRHYGSDPTTWGDDIRMYLIEPTWFVGYGAAAQRADRGWRWIAGAWAKDRCLTSMIDDCFRPLTGGTQSDDERSHWPRRPGPTPSRPAPSQRTRPWCSASPPRWRTTGEVGCISSPGEKRQSCAIATRKPRSTNCSAVCGRATGTRSGDPCLRVSSATFAGRSVRCRGIPAP